MRTVCVIVLYGLLAVTAPDADARAIRVTSSFVAPPSTAICPAARCGHETARRTRIVTYEPLDQDGTLRDGLTVDRVEDGGTCDRASRVVSGTFACLESRAIEREPCWLDTRRSPSLAVLCVTHPWARAAIAFDVSSVPQHLRRRSLPWALELMSGRRCVAQQLFMPWPARRDFTYLCARSFGGRSTSSIHALFGRPRTTAAIWTIRAGLDRRGGGMRVVHVRVAWR